MGFLDLVTSGVKALGRGIGSVIESAGILCGSDKIARFGSQVKNACSTVTQRIKEERVVEDTYRAPVQQVERVNNIFVEFYEDMEERAEEIEELCIEYVENYFEELTEILEKSGEGILKKQNFQKLSATKRKIRSDISGAIREDIATKISMDNMECKEILRMKNAEMRAERMEEYCELVVERAVNKLNNKVEKTLRKQSNEIIRFLEEYLEKRELELEKKVEQLEELEISCNNAENEVSQLVEPIRLYTTADMIIKILNNNETVMNR